MNTTISYRPAVPNDYPAILKIANEPLGANYLGQEDCLGNLNFFLVAVATVSIPLQYDDIVWMGTAQGYVSVVGYAHYTFEQEEGYLNEVAVYEQFQHRGIATELVKAALEDMHTRGVPQTGLKVQTHAWEYPDGSVPARKCLEENGFWEVEYIPQYYYRPDSDYICPCCGYPCRCSAFLYQTLLLADK